MAGPYRKALFIFRRDLRLADNSALIAALRQSASVLTLFVADEHLLKPERQFANAFLKQSLLSLERQLAERGGHLCLLAGPALACIEAFIARENIDAVFINRDYTPYARKRDSQLQVFCDQRGIGFHAYADQLLVEPEQALKKDGTPYTVFTPFFRNAAQFSIATPQACPQRGFAKPAQHLSLSIADSIQSVGDRQLVADPQKILSELEYFGDYEHERNLPALDKTTRLSVHIKFGTCSVREIYHCIKTVHSVNHGLIRELFWRDFFTHIAWYFPAVFVCPFRPQYQSIKWSSSTEDFQAWCEGRTGFPIVDAGMRELNTSGFMHGRLRMIAASFLVKHLHINWQWGERYFRQQLLDYDPSVNNGNWQWVASTGCDAQPWFRIFNPWLQQKKFDAECSYIKTWIPELRALDAAQIHAPDRMAVQHYPAPMLEHAGAVAITKQLYGSL